MNTLKLPVNLIVLIIRNVLLYNYLVISIHLMISNIKYTNLFIKLNLTL